MAANPLAGVKKVDETGDVRRARRSLTVEQVAALLAAVPERHQGVYRFALATGLRRQEVADLVWGDVRQEPAGAFLKLRAKATKARRADSLPLRADLASELADARGEAADGYRVFTDVPTIKEHRAYLSAAGIEWTDSEGRRADFHALRHTFGTLLSNAGVAPREAMDLMRHTDMRLTMNLYTDSRVFKLAGAVEKLTMPAFRVAQRVAPTTPDDHSSSPTVSNGGTDGERETTENKGDCQRKVPIVTDGHSSEANSAGRTRTYNQPVNRNRTRQGGIARESLELHGF